MKNNRYLLILIYGSEEKHKVVYFLSLLQYLEKIIIFVQKRMNMKPIKFAFTLLLICISAVCSAQVVVKTDSVRTEFHDGEEWAYATKNGFSVAVALVPTKTDYGTFYQLKMAIENLRDSDVLFIPGKISACIEINHKQKPLEIYSSSKFERKIETTQAWESILLGLAAGFDNRSSVSQNITSSILLDNKQKNDMKILNCGYMKKNTIKAHYTITGFVNMKRKNFDSIEISLPVDNTIFVFKWALKNDEESDDAETIYLN